MRALTFEPEEPQTPDELYKKWEGLAFKFAKGPKIPGFDFEDIVQEFRVVIFKCTQVFNPQKGCFFAFAKKSILNHRQGLRNYAFLGRRHAEVCELNENTVGFSEKEDFDYQELGKRIEGKLQRLSGKLSEKLIRIRTKRARKILKNLEEERRYEAVFANRYLFE